jgi:hypothetical protein
VVSERVRGKLSTYEDLECNVWDWKDHRRRSSDCVFAVEEPGHIRPAGTEVWFLTIQHFDPVLEAGVAVSHKRQNKGLSAIEEGVVEEGMSADRRTQHRPLAPMSAGMVERQASAVVTQGWGERRWLGVGGPVVVEEHRNGLQGPILELQCSNKLQLSELEDSAQRQSLEVVEGTVGLALGRRSGCMVDRWVDPLGYLSGFSSYGKIVRERVKLVRMVQYS